MERRRFTGQTVQRHCPRCNAVTDHTVSLMPINTFYFCKGCGHMEFTPNDEGRGA